MHQLFKTSPELSSSHTTALHSPTLGWRNLGPMRESFPIAWATSLQSAPVASHIALTALILDMRCARNAFAAWICYKNTFWEVFWFNLMRLFLQVLLTSFDSSDDHVFVVIIRSWGTQWRYIQHSSSAAALPSLLWSPPIKTLSGLSRSAIAVPSARNSGFDRT